MRTAQAATSERRPLGEVERYHDVFALIDFLGTDSCSKQSCYMLPNSTNVVSLPTVGFQVSESSAHPPPESEDESQLRAPVKVESRHEDQGHAANEPEERRARASHVATLDAEAAIIIYRAKERHTPRDNTSSALAEEYGITMKAVRDIWNLRTWAWTTMPYWTKTDLDTFLKKHLGAQCRGEGVKSIAAACKLCASPRRRGRPTEDTTRSPSISPFTSPRLPSATKAYSYPTMSGYFETPNITELILPRNHQPRSACPSDDVPRHVPFERFNKSNPHLHPYTVTHDCDAFNRSNQTYVQVNFSGANLLQSQHNGCASY